jgi:acetyltransferase-like isoleucine patch superfamily enzyme
MINKLLKITKIFCELNFKFLKYNSIVRNENNSKILIAKNVKISNSYIFVTKGSTLVIEKGCDIKNLNLFVNGKVTIGENNIIDNGYCISKLRISVNGTFILGAYNRIRSIIWIRFNGKLVIGSHNNINEESEIRCDEKITIGSYNQISYKCMIWDTNTHNIYSDEKRRELTDKFYPIFGYEYEKPKTKALKIGDDCWIGREAALLKGVELKNSSIVGFRTTLSNCSIEKNKIVVSKSENLILEREKN